MNEVNFYDAFHGQKATRRTLLVGVAFLVILGGGFFVYQRYSEAWATHRIDVAAQKEINSLVEELSVLIVLPENEEPTVATITDLEKLKDQPFFAGAREGFKVFIYSQSKKAILYDPFKKKIVEVAPLNIDTVPR
jgi:hypothetical protein